VGPDFLATLGLAPLRGSEFDAHAGSTGQAEAIVNHHLADALWPGEAAIGKTIRLGNLDDHATVIGIAPDALIGGYRRDARTPIVLMSARQTRRAGSFMTFYVRYQGQLDAAVPAITRAMRDAAPMVPVAYVRTAEATMHEMTWSYRTLTLLLLLFAAGSFVIAATGQYAAMSFAIRQRIRDFAVRMAMGASAAQIRTRALAEGLLLTGAGLALGFLLSAIAGRSGRSLLHGVTPTDPATYGGVLIALGVASLAACYLPARRASRVDPIEALRAE
jgi:predicted lysophospholipase L1 biosynthesis ABC-type transport system permease subunit